MAAACMFLEGCADKLQQKESSTASVARSSTLDSMQGDWISVDDTLSRFSVKGRTYHEWYVSGYDTLVNEFSRIYFSDTLVDCMEHLFNEVKIDTTSLSGNYFLTVSKEKEGRFWCYELYGFYTDVSDTTTISIADTWAKQRPSLYRKIKQ